MKIEEFKIIQKYTQKIFNENKKTFFNRQHLIYKEVINFIFKKKIKTVAIYNFKNDWFDGCAIIDELIRHNINVCAIEFKNKKIIFNEINNVFNKIKLNKNYYEFIDKNIIKKDQVDLILVCTPLFFRKNGIIFWNEHCELLKKSSIYKVGVCLKHDLIQEKEITILNNCDNIITFNEILAA